MPEDFKLSFYPDSTIMSLRNKVDKIMNIHPYSFLVVRMNSQGVIESILNSTSLIRGISAFRNETLFLFEINPKIFCSIDNIYYNPSFDILSQRVFIL